MQDTSWKNVPNALSALRLILSAVLFALIGLEYYLVAFFCFVVAAITDFVDGWWARKYNQKTQLGRILDPFADKTLICGTFIFLAAIPALGTAPCGGPWGIQPWMAVVIVCREMLITAIRGFFEQRGVDFSAKWSGKIKMGFQCVCAASALLYLELLRGVCPFFSAHEQYLLALQWVVVVSAWVTILSTLQSGFSYVRRALQIAYSDSVSK